MKQGVMDCQILKYGTYNENMPKFIQCQSYNKLMFMTYYYNYYNNVFMIFKKSAISVTVWVCIVKNLMLCSESTAIITPSTYIAVVYNVEKETVVSR